MVLHIMTYMERLEQELEYFEFQLTISGTEERTKFLSECAINCRARIAKYQIQLDNEQSNKPSGA